MTERAPRLTGRRWVRIAAVERRRSALHEAAHALVAWKLGLWAEAEIYPTFSLDRDKKAWRGRCRLMVKGTTLLQRRAVAAAGAIAEAIADGDDVSDIDWHLSEVMSPTDWQMAELPPGKPNRHFMRAVKLAHGILLEDRHEHLAMAREPIVCSRRPDPS
jgi:hypothetical protein